ncbi:MAG: hypothetical protein ABI831_03195 [Betaproteobacteria bacterium]
MPLVIDQYLTLELIKAQRDPEQERSQEEKDGQTTALAGLTLHWRSIGEQYQAGGSEVEQSTFAGV